MDNVSSYQNQKKYFEKRKQLRVWVENEKYERFRQKAEANGESLYSLINRFIDDYCREAGE